MLGLPPNAVNEYLFGSCDDGLMGVLLAVEDSEIAILDGKFKLLTSKDYIIKDMAWSKLEEDTNFHHPFTRVENMQDFLNSEVSDSTSSRCTSCWTRTWQASKWLNVRWNISENCEAELLCGDDVISDRKKVFSTLRRNFREKRTTSLRDLKKHQGKTNFCVTVAKESTHFIKDGMYTSFKDWRFIHCARLGVFDLNGYKKESRRILGPVNRKCRRCQHIETLPHVLDHCMFHSTLCIKMA